MKMIKWTWTKYSAQRVILMMQNYECRFCFKLRWILVCFITTNFWWCFCRKSFVSHFTLQKIFTHFCSHVEVTVKICIWWRSFQLKGPLTDDWKLSVGALNHEEEELCSSPIGTIYAGDNLKRPEAEWMKTFSADRKGAERHLCVVLQRYPLKLAC